MILSLLISFYGLYKMDYQISTYPLYILFPAAGFNLIAYILALIILLLGRKQTQLKYSFGGELSDWYEPTYLYNKSIHWLDTILNNLQTKGVSFQKSIIFSPSANIGKYEYDISKRYPNSIVVATDITAPNDHLTTENNFTYLLGNNNAMDARNFLKGNNIDKVDIIFDIKGALWYSDNDLERLLKEYYFILNKGGNIVFDAYGFSLKYLFRMNPRIYGYRENSTFSKINKKLNKSEWVFKHFEIILAGKGETKIAILRKK